MPENTRCSLGNPWQAPSLSGVQSWLCAAELPGWAGHTQQPEGSSQGCSKGTVPGCTHLSPAAAHVQEAEQQLLLPSPALFTTTVLPLSVELCARGDGRQKATPRRTFPAQTQLPGLRKVGYFLGNILLKD